MNGKRSGAASTKNTRVMRRAITNWWGVCSHSTRVHISPEIVSTPFAGYQGPWLLFLSSIVSAGGRSNDERKVRKV